MRMNPYGKRNVQLEILSIETSGKAGHKSRHLITVVSWTDLHSVINLSSSDSFSEAQVSQGHQPVYRPGSGLPY